MPYQQTSDLPDAIKNKLPQKAQEIYMEAYNNAWSQYKDPQNPNEDREQVCHKVAWSAVKAKYHKNTQGEWVEN